MNLVGKPKELAKVTRKVVEAVNGFAEAVGGITDEELDGFEGTIEHMDTVMGCVDPTAYRDGGADLIDVHKARVKLIRGCKELTRKFGQ